MRTDAQIIDDHGGPAKVAEMLGYDPKSGTQRVHNWKTRGIPPAVRLEHLELFGMPAAESATNQTKEAA